MGATMRRACDEASGGSGRLAGGPRGDLPGAVSIQQKLNADHLNPQLPVPQHDSLEQAKERQVKDQDRPAYEKEQ